MCHHSAWMIGLPASLWNELELLTFALGERCKEASVTVSTEGKWIFRQDGTGKYTIESS